MPKSRNTTTLDAADYLALGTKEAHVLATLKGYAEALGGFTRHVRRANGQDLVGLADCLLWVPTMNRRDVLHAAIEIKIGADTESPEQAHVRDFTQRIAYVAAEVLREGAPPRPGERSLTEVLDLLEGMRGVGPMTGRIDRSYRVSVFDEFVSVSWWPDRPDLPPLWGLWDCSGPSMVCLDVGRGDPPGRYFPLGIVPDRTDEP